MSVAAEARLFRTSHTLRFGQCDPAGIAFYPRLIETVTVVIEEWFEGALGHSFHVLQARGLSVPTVRLEVEFPAAVRLGNRVDWSLGLTSIGRTSASLGVDAVHDGRPVVRARPTIVCCDMTGGMIRPVAWPDVLRAPMQWFCAATG